VHKIESLDISEIDKLRVIDILSYEVPGSIPKELYEQKAYIKGDKAF